jgi:ATP-dependent Clp protease adaptor protein ClpS
MRSYAAMPAPPVTESDTKHRTRQAPMYKVLLHDDDVTPFDFVQRDVCQGVFRMDAERAFAITNEVHKTGIGLAGVYPLEQAEFKCEQVHSLARGRGFPLRITYEPA